jgi:hypothetical protein
MKTLIPFLVFAFAVLASCNPQPQCCVPGTPIFDDPCEAAFNAMWAPAISKRTWHKWPYDYTKLATWQSTDFLGQPCTIEVDPTQHSCVSEFWIVNVKNERTWMRFYPYTSMDNNFNLSHAVTDSARFVLLDDVNQSHGMGFTFRPHDDTLVVQMFDASGPWPTMGDRYLLYK